MAARDSLPGFLFNVQKWRGSRSAQRMSFAQRGVYLEMLFEQWEKRYLADDAQAVAEAIATTPDQIAEVLAAWPVVRPKFSTADRGVKRIFNVALERTRRDQRANLEKRREAGKLAGKASAAKRKNQSELDSNERSTNVEQSSTNVNRLEKLDQIREVRSDGVPSAPAPSSLIVTDETAERAAALLDTYDRLYAQHRHGAKHFRRAPALHHQQACDLVNLWPDDRLVKMIEILLTTDDEWVQRTDRGFGVFVTRATWCDEKLSAWEASQKNRRPA